MAFKPMTRSKYPPRLWSLVGYPGSGKSTFATQMKSPLLIIDSDHRFAEVMSLVKGAVYQLSETPADNVAPVMIAKLLSENMPGSDVKTIAVDSLTAIVVPLVVKAMMENAAGENKNKVTAFQAKALAFRQVQDAVSAWGADTLWIYHLQDSRDEKAKLGTHTTISQTELDRLQRSINLSLQIVQEGDKRGVKVLWARNGKSGITLWDASGTWRDMPAKIEAAVYDGAKVGEITPSPAAHVDQGERAGAPGNGNGQGKPTLPLAPPTPPDLMTDRKPKKRSWPGQAVKAVLASRLAANGPEAVNMLNLSQWLGAADPEDVTVAWAKRYREACDQGQEPDQAAALADWTMQTAARQEAEVVA